MSIVNYDTDAAAGKRRKIPSDVIYLRVPSSVKAELDDLTPVHMGEGRRLSHLLNKILLRFTDLDLNDQRSFLQSAGPAASFDAASVHHSWAEHAFIKKHWEWACAEYLKVWEFSQRMPPRYRGTWKFAQFRLGYCWTEVAIALQNEAVYERKQKTEGADLSGIVRMFRDVKDALDMGLRFYGHYEDEDNDEGRPAELAGHPSHAIVRYNMACIWSLMAESRAQEVCECRKLIEIDKGTKGGSGEPEGRDDFLRHLESCKINSTRTAREEIDENTSKALDMIEALREGIGDDPTSSYGFIFRLARHDPDLAWLRNAKWKKFSVATAHTATTTGDAYRNILRKTKEAVKRMEGNRAIPRSGSGSGKGG